MRLLNYIDVDGPAVALFLEGRWVNLSAAGDSMPTNVQDMLVEEFDSLEKLAEVAASAPRIDTQPASILPPIAKPQKIICVGLNYLEHAKETGQPIPDEPLIFSKLSSTLIGHEAKIVLPSVSDQVDFEAELVVVIGKRGRNILAGQALGHVAGYCCGNDVSARDWQKGKPGRQWLLGKSFDTFAPLGPWMIPAEAIPDPGNLDIQSRVNGKTMQHSNTRDLIFPVAQLISYISSVCTLEVGDLLFTGTPSGVGVARQPPQFLAPGDRVEVEIEQIGTLANSVVASE